MGTLHLIDQVVHLVFVAAGLPLSSAASESMGSIAITLYRSVAEVQVAGSKKQFRQLIHIT